MAATPVHAVNITGVQQTLKALNSFD
ncbi:hypothetical protein UFOVP877_23, partial [uncultured Caudovirales phage]